MAKILWLASYPKSGNTWVRSFLANYLQHTPEPFVLNDLRGVGASSRIMFDAYSGVDASDLTDDEIASLRPDVYRVMAATAASTVVCKVHDAFMTTPRGEPLFPADATVAAIYIVRNPLDVAVSLSFHNGSSIDEAIADLCEPGYTVGCSVNRPDPQLFQDIGPWPRHVNGWINNSLVRPTVVRYEDLLADPEAEFRRVVSAGSFEMDPVRLQTAIQHSRFEVLRSQELKDGFKERPSRSTAPFFREGKAGGWRMHLSAAHVLRVIDAGREVMTALGYLDGSGSPVY